MSVDVLTFGCRLNAFESEVIAREAEEDPELVKGAPYTAPLRRLDEATAARKPVLRWRRDE